MSNLPPKTKATTAFISGPLDASPAYFTHHYLPHLTRALTAQHSFVIGPVSGIDTLALTYVLSSPLLISPAQIAIYMTSWEASLHLERLEGLGVRVVVLDEEEVKTTRERDAAMTRESGYDVLRFRTERECMVKYGSGWRARVSNTEMNWRRRTGGDRVGGEYVRHVGSWEMDEEEEARKSGWKGRVLGVVRKKERSGEDGVETCDGSCDGHAE